MSPPAQAGSYGSPQYTGGTGDVNGSSGGPFSYTSGNSGYGGSYTGGGSMTLGCMGAITTDFAYTPATGQTLQTDPPPANVIVAQTSVATWGLSMWPDPMTGMCSNGLNDPAQTTGPTNAGAPGVTVYNESAQSGETASGTPLVHYSVVPGQQRLSLSCTPTSSITGNVTGRSMGVSAFYTAAAYPVTITLGGATNVSGAEEALTGQQITASVSLGGAPSGTSVQSVTWSTSGGSPFGTWSNVTPQIGNTPANQYASYLGPVNTSATILKFYDAGNQDTVAVSCTATIQFPDSTTQIVTINSTSATTVMFMKPSGTWIVDGPGNSPPAGIYTDTTQSPGTILKLNTVGAYEWWSPTTITLPTAFTSVGGTGIFAQTIQYEGGSFTGSQGTFVGEYLIDGSSNYGSFQTGLDLKFPYGGNSWTISPSTGTGMENGYGDVPSQPYQENIGTGWTSASAASSSNPNSYNTWLMYGPKGGVWVPLQMITWSWYANLTNSTPNQPPGTWTFTSSKLTSPVSPDTMTGVGTLTTMPPSWSHVVGPGQF